MKKKVLIAVCALVLVIVVAIGGTVAWLTDSTDELTNTFTYGDINISLWEHKLNADGTLDTATKVSTGQTGFKMIPGNSIAKNPTVTVEAGSEDCWLFVQITESEVPDFDAFMTYSVDTSSTGWTQHGVGVYYRKVSSNDINQDFAILQANQVTVNETVTKEMLNALTPDGGTPTYPTLSFRAYAVQQDSFETVDEAWSLLTARALAE